MYAHAPAQICMHTHTQPCIYMCAHRSRHACIPRPICIPWHTHIYTDTKLPVCIQMASVMYTHVHTGLHSRTCTCTYIYIHACLLRTVPHCQCSAIMNSQADPWFPAPSGWLSLPSPQPHDRQLGSCQPQCLPLASHPPGVPRSLINPLTNWPPAP